MQNTSSSSVASTKLGTAVNSVEKNTMIRSGSLLRIRAAMLPKTVPSSSATTMAITPSLAEMGKDSPMMEEISRPFFSETPKSPWRMPFIYRKNCSPRGLVQIVARVQRGDGGLAQRLFPVERGRRGPRASVKKVMAQMMKTVTPQEGCALRYICPHSLSPFWFRFDSPAIKRLSHCLSVGKGRRRHSLTAERDRTNRL